MTLRRLLLVLLVAALVAAVALPESGMASSAGGDLNALLAKKKHKGKRKKHKKCRKGYRLKKVKAKGRHRNGKRKHKRKFKRKCVRKKKKKQSQAPAPAPAPKPAPRPTLSRYEAILTSRPSWYDDPGGTADCYQFVFKVAPTGAHVGTLQQLPDTGFTHCFPGPVVTHTWAVNGSVLGIRGSNGSVVIVILGSYNSTTHELRVFYGGANHIWRG